MRIPNSITERSIVRIAIQVDGSFNETLELTGAQLRKLASLLSGVPGPVVAAKLVAGDEAAEKREEVPEVKIETERPDSSVVQIPGQVPGNVSTPQPETTSTPQPETISTPQPETGTSLPDVTPDLGK